MSRKRKSSLRVKALAGVGAAVLAAGITAVSVGTSQAGEACAGLDQALQNNQNFIAQQKANPDAQSEARIANRQAVVDLIQQRRQAAGCQ
ncbi:hypothetical protein [Streptomyces winkii]|uniref:hypothetical protein n=1 Tax=Streptomyces winkii TaxID=3051178 RepID=UPI0028D68AAD|nr:hypothetical protein [Streptomyces sp. DSM 40971]